MKIFKFICRSILWIIICFYTIFSFTMAILIFPLFIVINFAMKDGTWNELFDHWKAMAFVGIDMLRSLDD